MKTVKLNEKAQRFLIPESKPYYIAELKATIFAKSDEEFEEKKQKLISKRERYSNGGVGKPCKIKDYGLYYKNDENNKRKL